jgi:osmotically-inducible protein OsmY
MAQDALTDREISNAIDDALINDPGTPAVNIDISTREGIVTLNGTVNNLLARDRAQAIAETVKGVRGVINRLTVEAPLREDDDIREDVVNALLMDPVTEAWEIKANVTDGMVILSGTVDSWQERRLAGKVVKSVRGVKEIDNNITIAFKTDRDDGEIAEEVKRVLHWDAYVDDAMIDVAVDDNEVSLSGTVGSMAEKTRARRKAWVSGVSAVNTDQLDVKWWARDAQLREGKYLDHTDAEIKKAVKDALLYDPRVNLFDIEVTVTEGYVTLRGVVDNLKAKRAAADDARNILGVWTVKNRIKVRPGTPSDQEIEQNMEKALKRDPYVDRYEITVSVKDGVANLYGDVDSVFEKAHADDVAARQVGVTEVNNFIKTHDPNGLTFDPYADDWYIYTYDWYVDRELTPRLDDWQILQDIEGELFWSPFVDSGEVDVAVDNGVAVLTGTVDTWSERQAAAENARQGGAIMVDNNLKVNYGPDLYLP